MLDKNQIAAERKKNELDRLAAKNKAAKVVEVIKEVEKVVEVIKEVDGLVPIEGTTDVRYNMTVDDFMNERWPDWKPIEKKINDAAVNGNVRLMIIVDMPKGSRV